MAKIVLVGDIHADDVPPVNTTETYTDDLIDMLHWINEYASKEEADAVCWAGDIFNKKQASKVSHRLVQKLIEVVQSSKIPIWAVTGNHDIANDRLDSLQNQPLGVLYRAGLHKLHGWHPDLPLFGVPWQQRWDNPAEWSKAFDGWGRENPALVVTHASIFPPGSEPPYEFLNLDDVAAAMENKGSLYYGHIHDYHGVFKHGGVTFCNVGSLSRGSLTESHIEREVRIAVWQDGVFTEVRVGNQKPSSKVLKIKEGEATKEQQLNLDAFLQSVGSSTLISSDTDSIVAYIREISHVSDNVKKRAIQIVESVA